MMSKVTDLLAMFHINLREEDHWSETDLDRLFNAVVLLAGSMGGEETLAQHIGGLVVERSNIGLHLGRAYRDRVQFSTKGVLTTWSVVHELAHAWDARNEWKYSRALERYTRGYTSRLFSFFSRFIPGRWDADWWTARELPGRRGRKPGCNAFGYFYGDKPSGSNWHFNRREDFAESVVMYCGWGRDNDLSHTAHGRIERYRLPNGATDPIYGQVDNWKDYARYFFPPEGDYTKTKRWEFIQKLMHDSEVS